MQLTDLFSSFVATGDSFAPLFLRVALGARKGWSKDGIIALLCEIARAKSLDAF